MLKPNRFYRERVHQTQEDLDGLNFDQHFMVTEDGRILYLGDLATYLNEEEWYSPRRSTPEIMSDLEAWNLTIDFYDGLAETVRQAKNNRDLGNQAERALLVKLIEAAREIFEEYLA